MDSEFIIERGKCCDLVLDLFKEKTPYRLDDAWDWLCDNIDLDKEFDNYLDDASKAIYNKTLFEVFKDNVLDNKLIAEKVSKKLLDEMENALWTVK